MNQTKLLLTNQKFPQSHYIDNRGMGGWGGGGGGGRYIVFIILCIYIALVLLHGDVSTLCHGSLVADYMYSIEQSCDQF